MGTPWDAGSYDRSSEPQQAWASEVLARLEGIAQDVVAFVPTSILAAHLARLPEERRARFAAAVVAGVRLPLDYVRLNISAVRGPT
jgi:hypothetical protein